MWRDHHTPPLETTSETMGYDTLIEEDFCFTEREPGSAPWLHHIICFYVGTKPSIGLSVRSTSSIRHAVPKLTRALARSLLLGDTERHVSALLDFDLPHLVIPEGER
jgi:hypothetical protein